MKKKFLTCVGNWEGVFNALAGASLNVCLQIAPSDLRLKKTPSHQTSLLTFFMLHFLLQSLLI
jgi:hypothetical protein